MGKRKVFLSLLMVFFLIAVMFSGCGQKQNESISASSTAAQTSTPRVVSVTKSTATPTATPTVKSTVAPTTIPTVKPTAIPTVKPTVKPTVAPTVKPTSTPTVTAEPQDANIFKTDTGTKYHRGSCSYLSKSKIPITLSEAKAEGLTPCSKCHPPE